MNLARVTFHMLCLVSFLKMHANQTAADVISIVDEIFTLLKSGEKLDYIGEPVSQLEHALQCAQGARDAHADNETIIAALLHDIGHLCKDISTGTMGAYGTMSHEKIGADYVLKRGFSQKIADLIDGHVQAKRYLTFKYPKYYEELSSASKQTLAYQGGPMTQEEAEFFELDPLFEQKLNMRKWDEVAKIIGAQVTPLDEYKDMHTAHLMARI